MAEAISQRGRNVVIAGGIFLVCFLAYWFVLLPKRGDLSSLKSAVRSLTEEYKEIRKLEEEYRRLERETESVKYRIDRRGKDFELSAFVAATEATRNFERSRSSAPHSEPYGDFEKRSLTFSYQGKRLHEIVGFLEEIEDPKNVVSIESLTVSPRSRTSLSELNLNIRLSTVVRVK
jgi:Tfp pilus assembly protein PilO